MKFKIIRRSRLLFLIPVILFLLVLLLAPMNSLKIPSFLLFEHSDKVIHTGLFFALGLTSVICTSFLKSYKKQLLLGLGFCLFLAVATELAQSMIPSRSMELFDLLADLLGATAALLILFIIYRAYHIYLRNKSSHET